VYILGKIKVMLWCGLSYDTFRLANTGIFRRAQPLLYHVLLEMVVWKFAILKI